MQHNLITPQDTVLIYISPSESHILPPKQTFRNILSHTSLIGLPFNTKHFNHIILKPTPIHQIKHTKRYTQILFEADISLILFIMNLKHTDNILESGTGSGTLTHHFSEILKDGRLISYERNVERFNFLKKMFENRENVSIVNGDVCDLVVGKLSLDGIFLDVPEPWLFVGNAWEYLKKGRVFCVFVPSVEQVVRFRDEVAGRFEMRMYENVRKRYDCVHRGIDIFVCKQNQYSHTGFLITCTKL